MGAIFPETYVHAIFALGEIEVNPNSHRVVVEMCLHIMGFFVCLFFPQPAPFPGIA